MSLMGESDLGFEAEVLGVRRGRHRTNLEPVNNTTVPEHVQQHMGPDVESLLSFGGDGACSPTKPALSDKDEKEEEEEFLIDI
jgi:hypothetical protein